MNAKKLLVSFFALAIVLFAVASVSAGEITNMNTVAVEVDGLSVNFKEVQNPTYISIIAGEKITVDVYFTSLVDDSDVTIELELEGEKVETDAQSEIFDVEENMSYHKKIRIEVPYELKDQTSDFVYLNIEIDGKDHKTELPEITLRVQRPSYNAIIKSITTPSSISAGETFPVDFVLKNIGYNDLEDLYVEVSIPELGISQGPKWIGDLVSEECSTSKEGCDEDDKDTVAGRLFLEVPFGAEAGVYNLEFTVYNDDTESTMTKQIIIGNDFSEEVITLSTMKTVSAGENAEFSFLQNYN